ncbi:MAG: hypothetical protein H6511_05985 [Holophagales bacterium]|nr:hypothetical protein [Holophagales bacterium]
MLDPAQRRLEVRARGRTLSETPLRSIDLLTFRPFLDSGEAPPLEAPAIWKVVRGPGDTDRETIAPTTLRPYSEEEERTEPTPAAGATPQPNPEGRKPASYRVALDNGWQLLISDQEPRFGWFRRFAAAVRDGWLRLRGGEPAHPPLVALTVSSEDARSLHHLFRSGIEILVLPAG